MCHLTFTDAQGILLFSADFLELRLDQLVAQQPWSGSLGTPISGVLMKPELCTGSGQIVIV
jgi:hypothetical protein